MFLLPDWSLLYGSQGLIPWEISDALSEGMRPSLLSLWRILSPLDVSADAVVYTITVMYILSLLGLAVGYKTRAMAVVSWLLHFILNTTAHFTAYGVETFTGIALFYCMVLPVGCAVSIGARKSKPVPGYLIALSVRLIQIHLCIMYLACAIEKAMGEQWWNGEAIWIAMNQDQFHTVNVDWMAQFPIVPKVLCWSTLLIETLYPVGIFWSKTKKFWLISIIGMHYFIGLFLGLHLFAILMILFNLTVFGHHCFGDVKLKIPFINSKRKTPAVPVSVG